MKQSRTSIGLLLFAVLSVTVLAAAPVSARRGADNVLSSPTTVATTSDDSTTGVDDTVATSTDGSHGNRVHVASLRSQAKSELQALRKGKAETTTLKRQKLCVNRQTAVDNKVSAFGKAADSHLTRLNNIFTKLQAYQADKQLSVSDYQTLVDAATAKQQTATTAVTALKTVAVNIDCTSTDPVSSLTVVKTAAHDARTALKDYRTALKNIVVALAQSSTKADDTTTNTGGTE